MTNRGVWVCARGFDLKATEQSTRAQRPDHSTLPSLLEARAACTRTWLRVPSESIEHSQAFSFASLIERGARMAASWGRAAVASERVLLLLDNGPELLAAWSGAVLSGMVPIVQPTPGVGVRPAEYQRRLGALLAHLRPRVVVASGAAVACGRDLLQACGAHVTTPLEQGRSALRIVRAQPDWGGHGEHPIHLWVHPVPAGGGAKPWERSGQRPRPWQSDRCWARGRVRVLVAHVPRHGADR